MCFLCCAPHCFWALASRAAVGKSVCLLPLLAVPCKSGPRAGTPPDQAIESWQPVLSLSPLASCHVLVPGTGHCPYLAAFMCWYPEYSIPPPVPHIIFWHLPSGTGSHFMLQPPRTCLACKFPSINSINYQIGVASPFLRSFPVFGLWRWLSSLRAFPWCVQTSSLRPPFVE